MKIIYYNKIQFSGLNATNVQKIKLDYYYTMHITQLQQINGINLNCVYQYLIIG